MTLTIFDNHATSHLASSHSPFRVTSFTNIFRFAIISLMNYTDSINDKNSQTDFALNEINGITDTNDIADAIKPHASQNLTPEQTQQIDALAAILHDSSKIVFFGGAGISTASGIPDFRSANGIFSKKYNRTINPETAVSHSFFVDSTKEFFDFYKHYLIYPNAKPNACHTALATLEKQGKLLAVVTQNIDGLHQVAGSQKVYELHGSVHRNYCMNCHEFYDANFILQSNDIPLCTKCNHIVKPDVVLYEEGLDQSIVDGAIDAIKNADTLIIGGTSLVVYPAAGLINYFTGKNLVLINKSDTASDSYADLVIHDSIELVLPLAVEKSKLNQRYV